ncbi:MAG: hypothetical protein DRI26_02530 [Chloroflexi bacterium]|nr:MAG: hypothetical protein DRI26_02530 [Chloroflexota bacterium]
MRRRPMLDEEGRIARDADGNIIYEEVPYDETQAQLEYMRGIAALSRRDDSGLSGESIKNIINEELNKRDIQQQRFNELRESIMAEIERRFPKREGEEQRMVTADEIRGVIKDELERRGEPERDRQIIELRERIDNIIHERERSEEIRRAISEQIEPIFKKMEELELATKKTSLTGESARLVHTETMAESWQRFFLEMGQMLDRNIRAALLNAVVSQLRRDGASEEVIKEVIRTAGGLPSSEPETPSRPSGLREKAKEFERKYLKPEAWSA